MRSLSLAAVALLGTALSVASAQQIKMTSSAPIGSQHTNAANPSPSLPLASTITEYCAGDANAGCPCNNPGSGPGDGCYWNPAQDFALRGGHLTSVGAATASLAADVPAGAGRVRLSCEGHRPGQGFSMLLQGHVCPYLTYGSGRRCITGPFKRIFKFLPTLSIETGPDDSTTPNASISSQSASGFPPDVLTPGSVRGYQLWYRDPVIWCNPPSSFNVSSGIQIVWGS